MSDAWTFRICEAPDDDWPSGAVAIGGAEGKTDLFVLAELGDARRRFDLRYLAVDHRHEPQATFWRGWFAFGFGGRAILYRDADGATVEIDLGCYFGEFVASEDYLLITSGQGIVRLGPDGAAVWRNDELGLDGVLIFDIEGDVIDGQGQWDAPDGWREFLVSLETGDTLEELPDEDDP